MSHLLQHVEDAVFQALEMSTPAIVEMFYDTAKRCKSSLELERVLRQGSAIQGLNKSFYERLMDIVTHPERYPPKAATGAASAAAGSRKRPRAEVEKLLDSDDGEDDDDLAKDPVTAAGGGHLQEEAASGTNNASGPITTVDHRIDADADAAELARLSAKLKGGDKKGMQEQVGGSSSSSSMQNVAFSNEDERRTAIEQLKRAGRNRYLAEREDRQLELQKRLLTAQKELMQYESLTVAEQQKMQLQEEMYKKAVEHKKRREQGMAYDGYVMPETADTDTSSMRMDKLQQMGLTGVVQGDRRKGGADGADAGAVGDQERFEQDVLRRAMGSFRKGMDDEEKRGYDLIMENQVEFEELETHGGNYKPKAENASGTATPASAFSSSLAALATGDGTDTSRYDKTREQRVALAKQEQQRKRDKLMEGRVQLPVYQWREQLVDAIKAHPVIVLQGETGSGKTTQVPQYLVDVGYGEFGKIGCTQPRRVAAMSVAARVAEEMGVKLGHEVGYSIRFEDCTSDKTIVKYMTDGMLLRDFLNEPDLASYSVLIIDEAHERTLQTDILFGLAKDIVRFREDFKLIISSATLDAEKFSNYFDGCPIFSVPGRRYPVSIHYTKGPEANYKQAAAHTVMQIHLTQPMGDILVFLTGVQDIEEVAELLQKKMGTLGSRAPELIVSMIYANLPTELQAKIFDQTPEGARKVVLATNIAETSITIDNIVYVIDVGFCKQSSFQPQTGMSSLQVVPVSKAAANQRAGRAGRVKPGKCFRLFTKYEFEQNLEDSNTPEILRANLCNVILQLKALNVADILRFDFMDPPPTDFLVKSLELLYGLMALNAKGELTTLGRRMAEFPLEPMMAKALISAQKYQVVDEVTTICAVLSMGDGVFFRPKEKQVHADNAKKNFHRPGGDHFMLLNIYKQWEDTGYSQQWTQENYLQFRPLNRARDIRDQLLDLLQKVDIEVTSNPANDEGIRKSILAGYFFHCARLNKNGSYTTLKNPHSVEIHPSSSLLEFKPKMVCYHELWKTEKEYMRECIEVQAKWLAEVAPYYYSKAELKLEEDGKVKPKNVGAASAVKAS